MYVRSKLEEIEVRWLEREDGPDRQDVMFLLAKINEGMGEYEQKVTELEKEVDELENETLRMEQEHERLRELERKIKELVEA